MHKNQNTKLCLCSEILLFHSCFLKSTPAAISAGMRIKGKKGEGGEREKHSPFPIPHKAPPIHTALFSALPEESVTRWQCFIFKRQITRSHPLRGQKKADSRACSAFSLQPETNLFGKLRAVQKETTHSLQSAQLLGAGRQTHTRIYTHIRTLTHSRTKWRL